MKVIAISLYGPRYEVYRSGCIANAELCPKMYPGWTCRFYVSQHIPDSLVAELRGLGAEVVRKESVGEHDGALWRFLPVSDPSVEVMVARDADARLNKRGKRATDEWLASDKKVHVIRDHPGHMWPMLAGLWGYRGTDYEFNNRMNLYLAEHEHLGHPIDTDQRFLYSVYMSFKKDAFIHSEFNFIEGEECHPLAREGDVWLGMPADRPEEEEIRIQTLRDGGIHSWSFQDLWEIRGCTPVNNASPVNCLHPLCLTSGWLE